MLDILINFDTTFDENSNEIIDRKLIAHNYIKRGFTIDFLSALPLDLITKVLIQNLSSKQLKLLSLLKLIRMLRVSRIVRALKVQRDLKS